MSIGIVSITRYDQPAMSLKLLFLVTEDWYFWSHRLPIARAALRNGYEVVVATRVGACGQKIRDEGFRLIPLQLGRESYAPWNEFHAIRELLSIYRREQPDIVHHVALKPILYGSIAALRRKDIRVINALAGLGYLVASSSVRARLLSRVVWGAFRFLLGRANSRVLLQNEEDRQFAVTKLRVPEGKTTVIRGSGVDMELFQPMPEPAGVPVVLLSSRMLWNKGITEFVEAARRLRHQGLEARFVLAGDTDASSPSGIPRRQLEDWQASGAVEWWGHRNDMIATLKQASLVCLPSHGGEGVPKALIEAAASGRAIVTTDVPGCRDIVRQGINGILVAPKDPVGLAHAIEELLKDPARRQEMGRRGREIAVSEFSEETVVEQTLALYREVLRQGAEAVDRGRRIPEVKEV